MAPPYSSDKKKPSDSPRPAKCNEYGLDAENPRLTQQLQERMSGFVGIRPLSAECDRELDVLLERLSAMLETEKPRAYIGLGRPGHGQYMNDVSVTPDSQKKVDVLIATYDKGHPTGGPCTLGHELMHKVLGENPGAYFTQEEITRLRGFLMPRIEKTMNGLSLKEQEEHIARLSFIEAFSDRDCVEKLRSNHPYPQATGKLSSRAVEKDQYIQAVTDSQVCELMADILSDRMQLDTRPCLDYRKTAAGELRPEQILNSHPDPTLRREALIQFTNPLNETDTSPSPPTGNPSPSLRNRKSKAQGR